MALAPRELQIAVAESAQIASSIQARHAQFAKSRRDLGEEGFIGQVLRIYARHTDSHTDSNVKAVATRQPGYPIPDKVK